VSLFRWSSIAWLVIGPLLIVMSMRGGDAAIVGWLLWLIWTAPVGMFWQFVVYGHLEPILGAEPTAWIGDAIAYVGAYLFWFVLVPWLFRWARRWENA
jgi:hypothetical protein